MEVNMRVPYGISNFEKIRQENYLYIDKTKYIELLEDDVPYQFFIRPRRFGKSLFLSTLENYYDLNRGQLFDELFNGLYIGENPTKRRNTYLILFLSFSKVITSEGKERLIESFDNLVISEVSNFLRYYDPIFNEKGIPENITGAEMAINYVVNRAKQEGKKILILIDEYDNFANDLITTGNKELYYGLLSSEGYVRSFYKTIKDGTMSSIDRVFMTGVSPIMLDDMTSGFNITKNLTLDGKYNEMLGFTREEVMNIVDKLHSVKPLDKKVLMEDMVNYYNGYLFCRNGRERVFNSNMVLYFINALIQDGNYPENMLDMNMKTDYKKIESMAFNFQDEDTIHTLITEDTITTQLVEKFNLEYMYSNKENFISLLFYMGMLTIKDVIFKEYTLTVPNYVIKSIFWEYFIEKISYRDKVDIKIQELSTAIRSMAVEGKIDLLSTYMNDLMTQLSNRDLIAFDEKHLKMILNTVFSLSGIYVVNSEYEVENGYRYIPC